MRAKTFLLTTVSLVLGLTYPGLAAPKYNPAEVAELVEIAVSEKSPETRRARAIRELEHTSERSHIPVLRRLLREERSLEVRLAAACTLAAHGDREAPRDLLLVSAYSGERTPSCTRTDVLIALGKIGDPASVFHLQKALESPAPANEPYYYIEACRALAALNTEAARTLLVKTLQQSNAPVRHAAVTPLSELARDRSKPDRLLLLHALRQAAQNDTDEQVAEHAASALLWIVGDGEGFFPLLESHPSAQIRTRAARAMNRHYLSPARLERLKAAAEKEMDPSVKAEIEKTLASQRRGMASVSP